MNTNHMSLSGCIVETQASQAETVSEPTLLYYSSGYIMYYVCSVCFKCSKNEIRIAMIQNVYLTKVIGLSFRFLKLFLYLLYVVWVPVSADLYQLTKEHQLFLKTSLWTLKKEYFWMEL